ncbi:MAG TPA: DUF6152 family protein [Gammaproteobacteria bacterium]|nr:DUF6152 family protein [Gammaproteobacteria bacterium]
MSRSGLCIACVIAASVSAPLAAHHSYVEFDQQNTIEIEGTLMVAAWQNPHTRLTVAGADGARWDIESSAVNGLRRAGAPLELFEVGSKVKVAGWPSTKTANRLFGTNILSAGGQELILFRAQPRWGGGAIGLERQTLVASDASAGSGRTIFRTWGSAYARPGIPDDPDASPASLFFRVPLPLTEAARQAQATFDAVKYNMSLGCAPKNMPFVMVVPAPIDFVDRGESILFRSEEFDVVRTIHMNSRENPSAQPKTPLGYSVGRWEGDTLVVETGSVGAEYLIPGVPLGPSASFVERFTPSADGGRLHYTIVITDPYSLTETVERTRSWIAVDEKVMPYNCTLPGR